MATVSNSLTYGHISGDRRVLIESAPMIYDGEWERAEPFSEDETLCEWFSGLVAELKPRQPSSEEFKQDKNAVDESTFAEVKVTIEEEQTILKESDVLEITSVDAVTEDRFNVSPPESHKEDEPLTAKVIGHFSKSSSSKINELANTPEISELVANSNLYETRQDAHANLLETEDFVQDKADAHGFREDVELRLEENQLNVHANVEEIKEVAQSIASLSEHEIDAKEDTRTNTDGDTRINARAGDTRTDEGTKEDEKSTTSVSILEQDTPGVLIPIQDTSSLEDKTTDIGTTAKNLIQILANTPTELLDHRRTLKRNAKRVTRSLETNQEKKIRKEDEVKEKRCKRWPARKPPLNQTNAVQTIDFSKPLCEIHVRWLKKLGWKPPDPSDEDTCLVRKSVSNLDTPENTSARSRRYQKPKPAPFEGLPKPIPNKEVQPQGFVLNTTTIETRILPQLRNNQERPPFRVINSPIAGLGVIATRKIITGEPIIEYVGELITKEETDRREALYAEIPRHAPHNYMFSFSQIPWAVDATRYGNAARFINHSCAPNCFPWDLQIPDRSAVKRSASTTARWAIIIFALKDIDAGTELTFDYRQALHEEPEKRVRCQCGTKECRGWMS